MRIPAWFWLWAAWMDRGKIDPRPPSAPVRIPAWAWVRYAIHKAARKPPPPPPPVPLVQAPDVFKGNSAWVTHMDDFAIEYLPLLAGYRGLVMQTLDGLNEVPLRLDRKKQFEDKGKLILSSSWCTASDPYTQGYHAAQLCHEHSFAGHWANAEKAYDSNGGDLGASKEWLRGWFAYFHDHGVSSKPLGVSCEPFSGMDHGAWQDAGACLGIQCYTAENGATIRNAVDWNVAHTGWKPAQIVPLIEPRWNGVETSTATYVLEAHQSFVSGLVLYPADQLVDRPDIFRDALL
jgi:hypothetical protein